MYNYEYIKNWASCADSLGINITNMNCSMIVDELIDQNCDADVTVVKSRVLVHTDGMNILGIITFTIAFSIALGLLEKGQVIIGAVSVLNEAIMKLIAFIMWYVTQFISMCYDCHCSSLSYWSVVWWNSSRLALKIALFIRHVSRIGLCCGNISVCT